jgi:hypothetical protein
VNFVDSTNFVSDTAIVLNRLMNLSPWLSTEVLTACANTENSLPNSAMLTLLYANPDAIQTILIEALKKRSTPIPDSLLDSVILYRHDTITPRTLLEDTIYQSSLNRNAAAYEMIARISQNGDSLNYDTLRYWLGNIQTPFSDAQLAMSYIETGQPDSALAVLNRLDSSYVLLPSDTLQLYPLRRLLTNYLAYPVGQQDTFPGPDFTLLDSSDVANLNSYAGSKNQHLIATGCIRNIVNILYGGDYFTPPYLPIDSNGNERMRRLTNSANDSATTAQEKHHIKVYPNPAGNYVIFDAGTGIDGTLTIFDMYGRTLVQTRMNAQKQVLNTEDLENGIYLWQVRDNSGILDTGKIEIVK